MSQNFLGVRVSALFSWVCAAGILPKFSGDLTSFQTLHTVRAWDFPLSISGAQVAKKIKRHVLSVAERLKGTENALKNRKTPKQLRPGLRAYRDRLRAELQQEGKQ